MNLSAFVKPCQFKSYQQGNIYCLYDHSEINNFDAEMLTAHYWQTKNLITGSAQGRGTTWFINYQNNPWVLRHYFRGGLIGKLIRDSYFFYTQKSTRAAQEFLLLHNMQTMNLPAPKPIAYRVCRTGLFYHADLLTERIDHAQDLVALLTTKDIGTPLWHAIGATIKQFHQQGIYHHDLNAHNILIDKHEKVWLIDFDRGQQRQIKPSWQQQNLTRLLRSFNKEKNKIVPFHWQQQNWQALIKGYQREP